MFQELCLVGLSIGGGMISTKVGRQGKPGRSSEVFSAPTFSPLLSRNMERFNK